MVKPEKINVLFMQSQSYWGSDSMIHGLIMQNLDRQRLDVHIAVNSRLLEGQTSAFEAVKKIPDLHIHPVNFGVSINDRDPISIVKEVLIQGIPSLGSLYALFRYARRNKIKIMHGTEKPRDAFYGYIISRLVGARFVIHLHVKVENWISPLTLWAMKKADALIGVSEFVASSAFSMGYPAEKIYYLLNSIDCSRWDPTIPGEKVRAEYGISPQTPLLAIISRLFPWKGHSDLIRALGIVKEKCPDVVLLIVGEDDPRATPGHYRYSEELKILVTELNLSKQVIFTGFRKDIPDLLAAADIFTMPSFEEPCAVAYLEAMAMKKPVIALDSGGTPQLVEQGKAGLLSQPGDIEQLAKNILTLLEDLALRIKMGDHGRRRVEEYFTPSRLADDVEQVYMHNLGIQPSSVQQTRFTEA